MEPRLRDAARTSPVVVLTGPRQSGKTTLARAVFPGHAYVSLEPLDQRAYATEDPRGFLRGLRGGAVLDEVQHVPELFSYLQEEVDRDPTPGRFVLTGSENFSLSGRVSQSLAGRAAMLVLLPPTYDELREFEDAPSDLFELLVRGSFPRPYDRGIPSHRWLSDYVTTYLERDVRSALGVTDLIAFRSFLALLAGRTAQEWNASQLGVDVGITHPTATRWLSVLEASYLSLRVPPLHRNLRKRLVKAPKVHLLDSGLACTLLGIETAHQLEHHPLRGAIFESWVVSEILKTILNEGATPRLFHYRDKTKLEVDLVVERPDLLSLIEMKSGATYQSGFADSLREVARALSASEPSTRIASYVVYGGDARYERTDVTVVPWAEVGAIARAQGEGRLET